MLNYDTSGVQIEIVGEEPGIYIFDNMAATGKTRLFYLLRELEQKGESIFTYTYNDILSNHTEYLDEKLKYCLDNHVKIIMLDRYDMYNGHGANLIRECSAESIIFIVCNAPLNMDAPVEMCFLEADQNKIDLLL